MSTLEIRFAILIILITVIFLAIMVTLYIRVIKKITSYKGKEEEEKKNEENSGN